MYERSGTLQIRGDGEPSLLIRFSPCNPEEASALLLCSPDTEDAPGRPQNVRGTFGDIQEELSISARASRLCGHTLREEFGVIDEVITCLNHKLVVVVWLVGW